MESLREEANAAGPLQFRTPLEIVRYPDPVLRAKNKRISSFDDKLEELVREILDVMYRTDGVGLSAPQVGVNLQLMVYNPTGERGKGQEYVLANPRITKYAKGRDLFAEGCLSFPMIEADVERPIGVKVEAQDVKGRAFSLNLKGWQARIFQHEFDHLEGVLYHDRMTDDVLRTIEQELKALEDEYKEKTGSPAPESIMTRLKDLQAA
eukprot:SM000056S17948  [mRNA]  locus=s56:203813:205658:- [translate_table: standard]